MAALPGRLKNTSSVAAKQARFGATATLYTIVVIAALVLVNWLANRYNHPFDTTANKKYTLSGETDKVVKNLKQDATIYYFDRSSGFNSGKGILDRYANLSSKIHVQYIDPSKQPTMARSFNIRSIGTAVVEVGPRKEEAKSLDEEGITGAFLKDLKGERRVCFVSGSQEHSLESSDATGLSRFKKMLERDNYKVVPVTLVDKTAVPSDCNVLVVAGPGTDYAPNEIAALKSYVETGGSALFALDPPLDFGRTHVADNLPLTNLLDSWGVTVDKDLVLEQNPVGQLFGYGPEVPLVSSYESHPIVSTLKEGFVGFPLARSLQVKNTGKATTQKLFSTTDHSIATFNLTTNEVNPSDPKNKKGPFVLGAAGTYDTGKTGKSGRFVVVGNSNFLTDSTISFQSNRDLALNAINWLSADEDLISIRPKENEDRRLNVTQRQMSVFQYMVLIAIPLLTIVGGTLIYLKRR